VTLRKTWAFIRLTRPVFLLGGALLYALGVAVAASQGATLHLGRALLGQLMVTAIQLMAHYANEYYDVQVDRLATRNRTWFSGGSGVLASGALARNVARRAMQVCAIVGLVAVVAVAAQKPIVGMVGVVSLLGSWFYSAPPLSLMSSGWGELTTSLIVALLVPLTGYAFQATQLAPIILAVCLPLILIHLGMLLAFEFPDRQADAAAGKRTLVVRWGPDRAALLHTALIAGAFTFMMIWATAKWPAARFVWIALPLAAWQIASLLGLNRYVKAKWQVLTLGAVGLFALTSALWLIGFIAAGMR
jgi:1,4-dihydroxy-2-naphthoate octaprenyltransferase